MLHALLHGKLDPMTLEPDRREDALTSTVFGTLALVDGWDILARWLGVDPPGSHGHDAVDCWFWPRLDSVEPDVLLRIGGSLIAVEAKYHSNRHDLRRQAGEERAANQLHRQHLSLSKPLGKRPLYPEPIERAIAECELRQVYTVDARREVRARRECEESRALLPENARLEVVTWQALYRLLASDDGDNVRWRTELRQYLKHCRLDTFESVRRSVGLGGRVLPVQKWRTLQGGGRFRQIVAVREREGLAPVRSWRATPSWGLLHSLSAIAPERSWAPIVLAWRQGSHGEDH